MNNREDFDKWYQDNCSDNHLSNEGYMFEEWLYLHKIIDELKDNCKMQDKTSDIMRKAFNKAIIKLRDRIKQLEAKNPDVPCPACKGEKKIIMGRNITDTGWCYDNCCYCNGKGTVSTVKALQYENEQLKEKLEEIHILLGSDKD